jgi:hypothetical protein
MQLQKVLRDDLGIGFIEQEMKLRSSWSQLIRHLRQVLIKRNESGVKNKCH